MRYLFLLGTLLFINFSAVNAAEIKMNIEDTVVRMPLEEGISFDDAVVSMKLRANSHNMKLVAEMPLSKQIQLMGKESRRMDIYQFCDPLIAQGMVEANINFAAYLPCRIALVEDKKGQGWLLMMNLDIMLNSATLGDELREKATKVRDVLTDIMKAGASGDL